MLQLPIYLQVSLGSGFLAYAIAYHGRRKNEKTVDLLFGTIAFSLPGLLLWSLLSEIKFATPQSVFMVISLNILLGVLWRKWGKRMWYKLMNQTRISNDEGISNTWQRIIQDTTITPTQIFVTLKNGKQLSCDNIPLYNNVAIPGWTIDDDGNIGMYVSDLDGEDLSALISDNEWGDLITYIPASEIHAVDFRLKKI